MRLSLDDERRLTRLKRLPDGQGVLSVYLRIEPGLALHHGHVPQLMDVLRDLRETAPEGDRPRIEGESERVLRFVREEYRPSGTGLAVFASRPRRLWETFALQARIPSVARFRPRPYLAPLTAVEDDYPRVAVVLSNSEKARFFSVVMNSIEAEHKLADPVPRKQRQGGWSAFKYQHDREMHIQAHLVHVVESLKEQARQNPFQKLVLGGPDDTTAALVRLLPKSLQGRLAGTFRAEMFATDDEVASAASAVAAEAERAEEERLARQVVDTAFAGGQAALGWPETMQTLAEGRVQTLVIAASRYGSDEADRAVTLAWDSGAGVEVAHEGAEEILAPHGGVGAVLRY